MSSYTSFEGRLVTYGGCDFDRTQRTYSDAVVVINGDRQLLSNIKVVGEVASKFECGEQGKYFFIKSHFLAESDVPAYLIYAVITGGDEHIFDKYLFEGLAKDFQPLIDRVRYLWPVGLFLGVLLSPLMIGFPLVMASIKVRKQLRLTELVQSSYNAELLEQKFVEGGGDSERRVRRLECVL